LDSEIDQRGGASEGGGDGAGLEVVSAGGATEGHVEVGVDVDAAGDDEKASGVDHLADVRDGELSGDGRDLVAADADVGDVGVRGGDDGAVANDGVKTHGRTSWCGALWIEANKKMASAGYPPPGVFRKCSF
jgi:hypothetical protein